MYLNDAIFKHIDSQSSLLAVDEIYKYFTSLEESKYDEILKNITLDKVDKWFMPVRVNYL